MGERAMTDDTPLRLKDACEIVFNGSVSVATLKAEHTRGNLEISKIGKAYYTTRAKLKEMEAKCRVDPPAQSSGLISSAGPGQSSTVEADAARASLLMNLDKLKKPSGSTSHRSIPSKTARRHTSQTF